MKCAYCGNEGKRSKEHIISKSVLDLFKECNITFDNNRVYKAEPMIRDVCTECNNKRISYIDKYAKCFISKFFLKEYEKETFLKVDFDYVMLQKVFLKYIFNDLRSKKGDISFFTEEIKQFLLDENKKNPIKNITILGGLSTFSYGIPKEVFGNKKLYWINGVNFIEDGIIKYIDYYNNEVKLNLNYKTKKIDKLSFIYLFRFNTGQFLILFWKDENFKNELQEILDEYPYSIFTERNTVILTKCTSDLLNYYFPQLIDTTTSTLFAEEYSARHKYFNEK
jgi:hypothetical protein|nr:MAG TPA_asm: restriction endonuclease [Caudoviricetes sp.]